MTPVRYSVVIPVYNEEECIVETYGRIVKIMNGTGENYELVFINDGSRDRTVEIITSLSRTDTRIRLVDFSRNFGHQIAVTAGLKHASGQAIIVIDADLQDPPEVIPQMIEKWKQGFDVVYGKRLKRQGESLFKKASAALFYRTLRSLTNVEIPVDTGDFRLMDRKVVDVMNELSEQNRFIRGLVSWVGFKQTALEYVRDERFAGETKYPLKKMLKFALDGITSFSYKPLKIATYLGFTLSAFSFVYLIIVLYQRIFTSTTITGWTSTLAINLLFNGITLMILGMMGEYIGRIYDESKHRPLYVIKNKVGFENEESHKSDLR